MRLDCVSFCALLVVFKCTPARSIFLVVPEDVPTALIGIYGFSPRLVTGNDQRLGFGFRLGNHADFQVMYELGPQKFTRPLQPIRVRSASYRERVVRRRPLLDLLFKAGLLREAAVDLEFDTDRAYNEPR